MSELASHASCMTRYLQSFQRIVAAFSDGLGSAPERDPPRRADILSGAIDQASKAITEGREAVQGLRGSTSRANDLAKAIRLARQKSSRREQIADTRSHCEWTWKAHREPCTRSCAMRYTGSRARRCATHSAMPRTKIEVELRYNERELRLRSGITARASMRRCSAGGGQAGHFGLHGMRERAELIGGKLTVWSAPDSGTEIEFSLPASLGYAAAPSPRPMGALRRWALRHLRRQS